MAQDDVQAVLEHRFGLTSFRPGQREPVEAILAGRDTLSVLPTGGGKSLIYQLPALLLPGLTLVVSPLIALMKDQVEGLRRLGVPATFVNSSIHPAEQRERLLSVVQGETKILYVAPERLRSPEFLQTIRQVSVSLIAIDEAHCISLWGHDFRPEYRRLSSIREEFQSAVLCAVTATATREVQEDIETLLGMADPLRTVKGFNRPNVFLDVVHASDESEKKARLLQLLRKHGGPGIIYVGTRADAEDLAGLVRTELGLAADFYHGQMPPQDRNRVQEAFMKKGLGFIVATNAFGMGIDRPDIRLIVHYSIPGTVEAYYQEAGRAGRDGLPARAVLIDCPDDGSLQEYFIRNCAPTEGQLRSILSALRLDPALGLEQLKDQTGCDQSQLRVAVARMEEEGLLRRSPADMRQFEYVASEVDAGQGIKGVLEFFRGWQAQRRKQFQRMSSYASSKSCRRRFILNHFGDDDAAAVEHCCDVCGEMTPKERAVVSRRKATSRKERAALFILGLVRDKRFSSVGHLASHLTEGTSQAIKLFGAKPEHKPFVVIPYGQELEMAEALTRKGLVEWDSQRRTLRLTRLGVKALDGGLAVLLED